MGRAFHEIAGVTVGIVEEASREWVVDEQRILRVFSPTSSLTIPTIAIPNIVNR